MDSADQPPQVPKKNPRRNAPKKSSSLTFRSLYLIFYNAVSAALWSRVLFLVLLTTILDNHLNTYAVASEYTKWVQTLAGLEILHAALGVVRAPILTTVMQVASRFLLVWGIAHFFPSTTSTSPAYASMLVAWSATEIIRYSYFALSLAFGSVPAFLTWLRYNTFFVLYPLGISSECWLVYRATGPAKAEFGDLADWGLKAVLGIYVPGSYVLFTHMMAQRRKILRGAAKKNL